MDRAKDARKAALANKSVLARLVPWTVCVILMYICPHVYTNVVRSFCAVIIPTFKSEDFQMDKMEKNVNMQLDLLDDFRRAMAGEPENPNSNM